ncbi:vimentin-type intermediate filament-associated coiled-coil protein-like [Argopecten irradians]|uniref:vimentin-type intermediate filament-associated coiled-coil protein-like n=1 Tax=Argopecten irradians TaxID=31199 RepID=UPI0037198809
MLSRTNIQEANKHLHAMHQRIASLENTIQHQNQTLIDRDLMYQQQFQQLKAVKEEEIKTIQNRLHEEERDSKEKDKLLEVQKQLAEEKDLKIKELEEKVNILKQILQFLPNLKSMVSVLDSVNDSPTEVLMNGDVENMHGNLRTNHTPKASSLARHYVTNMRSRNFSISEDSDEDNKATTGEGHEVTLKIDTIDHNKSPIMESPGTLEGKEYYL